MRRKSALVLPALLVAMAAAPPARAVGTTGSLAMFISLSAGGGPPVSQTVPLGSDDEFFRTFNAALAGLSLVGDVHGDPDPVLDYTLEVQSSSAQTEEVSLLIVMPIVPLATFEAVSASLEVSVLDADGSGGASVGTVESSIQRAMADEGGLTALSLGVDLGTGVSDPGGSFSAGPVPGPAPRPSIGDAFVRVAILTDFTLSPGDTAILTGNLTIVPEPGPAWLLGAVAFSAGVSLRGAARGRPRRRAGRPGARGPRPRR